MGPLDRLCPSKRLRSAMDQPSPVVRHRRGQRLFSPHQVGLKTMCWGPCGTPAMRLLGQIPGFTDVALYVGEFCTLAELWLVFLVSWLHSFYNTAMQ
jgi:hypothetical protein